MPNSDDDDSCWPAYLGLMRQWPEWFRNHPQGGIEILTSPDEVAQAQQAAGAFRAERGLDTADLRAGLLARDPYMTIVRDAVRFPDGSLGLYNRILETNPVAVIPLLDGRPVMMRVFRHGLRDWSLEFPRGACDTGEAHEAAARREVAEEIGAETLELIPLGTFTPGGSSLSIRAHLFAARVGVLGSGDALEGIEDVRAMDVAEVEARMASGEVIDGFSLALFLRARLNGLV